MRARPIRLELAQSPVIGVTSSGQKIHLGGFSGLRYLGRSPTGLFQFVTHTDRGPNADQVGIGVDGKGRPFAMPEFQPRMVFLDADVRLKKFFVRSEVPLTLANGRPVSGLPPESASEVAVDFRGQTLGAVDGGLDLEGVALAGDGTYWLCDEYGPSLARFSADGVLLEQLLPGKGLPESLRYRRPNRGFEGIAISGKKLYAALESPLDNPPSEGYRNSRESRVTRLIEVDLGKRVVTAQYAYLLDEADTGKLSDICMEGPDQMLAIENGSDFTKLYRVNLAAATNLQRLPSSVSGPGGSLEKLSEQGLAANGVGVVRKKLQLELHALGMKEEKFEGVDRIDDKFIALLTDNDFGLAGGIDLDKGIAVTKDEKPALYFVPLLK